MKKMKAKAAKPRTHGKNPEPEDALGELVLALLLA
jgi:hypothetical protein